MTTRFALLTGVSCMLASLETQANQANLGAVHRDGKTNPAAGATMVFHGKALKATADNANGKHALLTFGASGDSSYVLGGAGYAQERVNHQKINGYSVFVEGTKLTPIEELSHLRAGAVHKWVDGKNSSRTTTTLETPWIEVSRDTNPQTGVQKVREKRTTITSTTYTRRGHETIAFAEMGINANQDGAVILGAQYHDQAFGKTKTTGYAGYEFKNTRGNIRITMDTEKQAEARILKSLTNNLSAYAAASTNLKKNNDVTATIGFNIAFGGTSKPATANQYRTAEQQMAYRLGQIDTISVHAAQHLKQLVDIKRETNIDIIYRDRLEVATNSAKTAASIPVTKIARAGALTKANTATDSTETDTENNSNETNSTSESSKMSTEDNANEMNPTTDSTKTTAQDNNNETSPAEDSTKTTAQDNSNETNSTNTETKTDIAQVNNNTTVSTEPAKSFDSLSPEERQQLSNKYVAWTVEIDKYIFQNTIKLSPEEREQFLLENADKIKNTFLPQLEIDKYLEDDLKLGLLYINSLFNEEIKRQNSIEDKWGVKFEKSDVDIEAWLEEMGLTWGDLITP